MPEIGQTLRETRLRNRIDITEVEAGTKIRAKYLRALENEEWDLLPGPTFVKTFLRTYADYLGLDSRLLVEEYKQRFERPSTMELTPFSPRCGGARRGSAAAPARSSRPGARGRGSASWPCSARSTRSAPGAATTTAGAPADHDRPRRRRDADADPRAQEETAEGRRRRRVSPCRSCPPGPSTSASSTANGKALINSETLQAGQATPALPRQAASASPSATARRA